MTIPAELANMSVTDAVGVLEGKAREYEQLAQENREAAATIRKMFGLTARQALTAPPATPATTGASQLQPLVKRRSPATSEDVEARRQRVLDIVTAEGPIYVAVLAKRPELATVGSANLHNDLQKLRERGAVKSTDQGWMAAAAAPPESSTIPKPTPPLPTARAAMDARQTMAEKVAAALLEGPFATVDKRLTAAELMPYVTHFAGVSIDHVLSALGQLVREKKITILSTGTERVYRRLQ